MDNKDPFDIKKVRPEERYKDALEYFKEENALRYASSKSLMRIQQKITLRAIELLDLKTKNPLILDVGSGSGFSSALLKEIGFSVVSLDINENLIKFYKIRELSPIIADMRSTPFKLETFDAILSISALQWVYKDNLEPNSKVLFITMIKNFYTILKPRSRAIFQFYPKAEKSIREMGKLIIDNTKFNGHFVIDNPRNPKKRRVFLFLEK